MQYLFRRNGSGSGVAPLSGRRGDEFGRPVFCGGLRNIRRLPVRRSRCRFGRPLPPAQSEAAELKLEAAQQNLTRVDDIVFEVEKQRGTLKRQAAKARRYRRLREELRRWEKVQFSLRYRALGAAIDAARTRLADAREREALAAARLAEIETAAEALRLELTQADAAETEARELAHARELAIGRLQQQVTFDRHQVETLGASAAGIEAEVASLEGRREPAPRRRPDSPRNGPRRVRTSPGVSRSADGPRR